MRRMQGYTCTALAAGETKVGCYAHHSPRVICPCVCPVVVAAGVARQGNVQGIASATLVMQTCRRSRLHIGH